MMPDDDLIHELLEEILDSQRTPEEVCGRNPELLREVRKRWERMQRVGHQIDELFPSPGPTKKDDRTPLLHAEVELPRIEGYDVEAILGRGGMGVVFQARQLKLNRVVALKMLLAGAYAGPQELARFRREAEAVAALRHPNIVQVHDAGELTGRPYFTMEYVEGGSLAEDIAGMPQTPRRSAELVATLASAVQFAHQSGFIHRDLKPANILLSLDGTPKITDFGLARSISAGPELTLSGARIGTPSYMAPEQAMGKASAIGPAVDVHALGAVLYTMLTGQPPFDGESALETEQKVIAEEPVPPSRLNPKVPRDLETICLKCLQKNPARRYASAQDLADDLHRFLDGEPVLARPVGVGERAVKWARRRPALATLSGAVAFLLAASIGLGVWMYQEEAARQIEEERRAEVARQEDAARRTEKMRRQERARQAGEIAVNNAYAWAAAAQWDDANRFLEVAASHLADANSDELRLRVDRAKEDVHFADRVTGVRAGAMIGTVDRFFVPISSYALFAENYKKVFVGANFDIDGDAAAIAAQIRNAPLGGHTIAALDEWALAAFMLNRAALQKQLLNITRLADPDPLWRDRLRDPALWRDKNALLRLADQSMAAEKPPATQHLVITSALLRNLGEKSEAEKLLRNALLHRPSDTRLNWQMAKDLASSGRHAEAATYLRIVIGLNPVHAWMQGHLGAMLCLAGEFDEGIALLNQALSLEPNNKGMVRHNLCVALAGNGELTKARDLCRRAIDELPDDPWAYHTLGILFARENRHSDAIRMLQKATHLKPSDKGAHWNLGVSLTMVGRHEEALVAFRSLIGLRATNIDAHQSAARALLKLGRHEEANAEFAWVIRELDPTKNRPDADASDKVDSRYLEARLGEVEALLGLGQFAETEAAAHRVLALAQLDDGQRNTVNRHRETARRLAPLESKLSAVVSGQEKAADVATQRILAAWLWKIKRHTGAAAQVYEALLTQPPGDERESPDRLPAACSAVLAGTGVGVDAASLSDTEKTAWRAKALAWLQAERSKIGAGADPIKSARIARGLLENRDLDAVRAESALVQLPAAERENWRNLWQEVKALAARDPAVMLEYARTHVDRKQWAKAAEIYARLLKDTKNASSEVWFECAAVQLLSGDRAAYRQTCKKMVDLGARQEMRRYLVARACTLGPDSVADFGAPASVSAMELHATRTQFWSLTEQGALLCRAKQHRQATPLFEQSIQAEPKPGARVLNWLWLSLAHHHSGDNDQARRWFAKAGVWLDRLGDEMPASADSLGLHRHNWLEAHVLRQEAEGFLSPSP